MLTPMWDPDVSIDYALWKLHKLTITDAIQRCLSRKAWAEMIPRLGVLVSFKEEQFERYRDSFGSRSRSSCYLCPEIWSKFVSARFERKKRNVRWLIWEKAVRTPDENEVRSEIGRVWQNKRRKCCFQLVFLRSNVEISAGVTIRNNTLSNAFNHTWELQLFHFEDQHHLTTPIEAESLSVDWL